MLDRIAWAVWKPLGPQTEPTITPTVLIFHTMSGYLRGTDSMFRKDGYGGTESTFGVGGPWDGDLDGVVWQWQSMLRQADAQWDGNAYANSVETSDGGDPSRPWSPKQLQALIHLTADWCRQTGNPCALVSQPTGKGLGYHEQFPEWNRNGHRCPGPVRERQLREVVIPGAQRLLTPSGGGGRIPGTTSPSSPPKPSIPTFPLPTGHWFGPPSPDPRNHSGFFSAKDRAALAQWQNRMRSRGWRLNNDGRYSPNTANTVLAFQREKRLHITGLLNWETWNAAWTEPVT